MTYVPQSLAPLPRVLLLAPFALFLIAPASAGTTAQERGSAADQEACTPDVFRLCSEFIPNEPQIVVCLEAKREQLSPACSRVFLPTTAAPLKRRKQTAPPNLKSATPPPKV